MDFGTTTTIGAVAGLTLKHGAFGWSVFILGVSGGIWLRFRGLGIPFLLAVGWWTTGVVSGHFPGQTSSGDNLAVEAVLAAILLFCIGAVGVAVGVTLRMFVERLRAH